MVTVLDRRLLLAACPRTAAGGTLVPVPHGGGRSGVFQGLVKVATPWSCRPRPHNALRCTTGTRSRRSCPVDDPLRFDTFLALPRALAVLPSAISVARRSFVRSEHEHSSRGTAHAESVLIREESPRARRGQALRPGRTGRGGWPDGSCRTGPGALLPDHLADRMRMAARWRPER